MMFVDEEGNADVKLRLAQGLDGFFGDYNAIYVKKRQGHAFLRPGLGHA